MDGMVMDCYCVSTMSHYYGLLRISNVSLDKMLARAYTGLTFRVCDLSVSSVTIEGALMALLPKAYIPNSYPWCMKPWKDSLV